MSVEFSAEFLAASPEKRIVMCLEMAGEAGHSASRASGETRDAFVCLARQWSALADAIEYAEKERSMREGKLEVDDAQFRR